MESKDKLTYLYQGPSGVIHRSFLFSTQALIDKCGEYKKERSFWLVPSLRCTFSFHHYSGASQFVSVHACGQGTHLGSFPCDKCLAPSPEGKEGFC